ncbi:MAG: excinuclease ABC subunit UvrC [Armatimonadota bacterium]|nr:excinuclease ABC subunit UvrC [Armatimonadota bacterium]
MPVCAYRAMDHERRKTEVVDQSEPPALDPAVLESQFPVTMREKLDALPARPGAYLMKDDADGIIYVGKALSLRSRVRSYFQKGAAHGKKIRQMVSKIRDIEWIVTDSELEALILECNLIKKHRPYYNVRLRDDKSYPYICLTTTEAFPRPFFTRKVRFTDGNRYFGPYTDAQAVRDTLKLIRRVFRIPCGFKTGQSRGRPCLYYHIGQCAGVCAGEISEDEYRAIVKDVTLFLEGRQERLLRELQDEMADAADNLFFEKAARLRDEIGAVQKLIERQKVISSAQTDQDVVAIVTDHDAACAQMFFIRGGKLIGQESFALLGASSDALCDNVQEFVKRYYQDATYVPREVLLQCEIAEMDIIGSWLGRKGGRKVKLISPRRGEKRRLVEMAETNAALALKQMEEKLASDRTLNEGALLELKDALGLPKLPRRIEAYDISNIMGREAVGSMVVFENGLPKKSDYRHFRIRILGDKPDDYAMIHEIVSRRVTGSLRRTQSLAELPDLFVIDGGKGQLNSALDALALAGENVSAVGLAKQYEEIYTPGASEPVRLPRSSPALRLMQRIRDEAHRFAITYHRKLRGKRSRKSLLDDVPGIGPKRRRALIKHFGSLERMRQASAEDLAMAPAMNRKAAETVYAFLHEETGVQGRT